MYIYKEKISLWYKDDIEVSNAKIIQRWLSLLMKTCKELFVDYSRYGKYFSKFWDNLILF